MSTKEIILQALKSKHTFTHKRGEFSCCGWGPREVTYKDQPLDAILYGTEPCLRNNRNVLQHGEVGRGRPMTALGKTILYINDASIDFILADISRDTGIKFRKTESGTSGYVIYYINQ